MITWYWSVKGGVGTSVVAAATAIRLASENHDTTLVDLTGDQPALLGMIAGATPSEPGIDDWVAAGDSVAADAIGRLVEDAAPGLRLLRRGTQAAPGARPAFEDQRRRLMLALEVLARTGPVVCRRRAGPRRITVGAQRSASVGVRAAGPATWR